MNGVDATVAAWVSVCTLLGVGLVAVWVWALTDLSEKVGRCLLSAGRSCCWGRLR